MTVSELAAELKKHPPDREILFALKWADGEYEHYRFYTDEGDPEGDSNPDKTYLYIEIR